ncbi:hypothetical protein MEM_01712 [Candida albicans L26]|uniref:Uncharacterized protein n=3 Tax=Candida albicans TaxID=5476 RepID=A0A1D8PGQ5_CANAL|nr:uncharacterized protein CAALFM_C202920WA [Candida albicans SC5314]EEQ45725.1 conserved hypothetical protein [Candida albicans WO-1]KGQ96173.1 hypothetical protein MEU_01699 [Candida albicans P37005]KGR14813.1 hypothetical protein MG3_01684 [Candida albicans P78048]KGR22348.1 hypothetical protein MG9_01703 [Candida albicans P37037]KGU13996.1 hypothetical protein MEY_01710 [Candida albicans 19F]KGU15104.1 hypothetical protein MEM_01712 [Candida albicans L26]KGU29623.1 hypothetical protein M|eukprot:XP_715354.1 hypothetical protein CAALFM_C202920WA [Candida albicans SC5314]
MKVTIRLSTESSFSVTIPDNATVDDLKQSIKVGLPADITLPPDFKVIYNGSKLQPYYAELQSFGMKSAEDNSYTVIVMSDNVDTPPITPQQSVESLAKSSTTTTTTTTTNATIKKTKKKSRCAFHNCNSAPLRMVGTCTHCQGKFCAKHRLLEDHMCTGLQYCKDNAHEKNAMKLQSERTIANRV